MQLGHFFFGFGQVQNVLSQQLGHRIVGQGDSHPAQGLPEGLPCPVTLAVSSQLMQEGPSLSPGPKAGSTDGLPVTLLWDVPLQSRLHQQIMFLRATWWPTT